MSAEVVVVAVPITLVVAVVNPRSSHALPRGRLRKYFVAHRDKMRLVVDVPPEWEASDDLVQWEAVIRQVTDLVQANTVSNVRAAFEPDFSTTTLVTATAARVALMAALKSYFDYGMRSRCGIRDVVLEGSVDDWIGLRAKVAHLGTLGTLGTDLAPWLAMLDTTLSKLVDTYRGSADAAWWSHVYSLEQSFESGVDAKVTGWFLHFFLYDKSGKLLWSLAKEAPTSGRDVTDVGMRLPLRQVNRGELPVGFASVPFSWELLGGRKREFVMYTGTWAASIGPDGSVSPVTEWAVVEKAEEPAVGDVAGTMPTQRQRATYLTDEINELMGDYDPVAE